MNTMADLCTWLESAPEGTTLSAQAMLELLRQITGAAAESDAARPIGRDMTLAEVGELYGRRPNTVRDWVVKKGLRAYLDATGQYRITATALEEWQETQRRAKEKPKSQEAAAPERAGLGDWRNHYRKAG